MRLRVPDFVSLFLCYHKMASAPNCDDDGNRKNGDDHGVESVSQFKYKDRVKLSIKMSLLTQCTCSVEGFPSLLCLGMLSAGVSLICIQCKQGIPSLA